jgi:NADH:ubiquinone oxidoreductase subunit E
VIADRERFVKRLTAGAAVVIVLIVTALAIDYAIARFRAPREDKQVVALEEKVRADASLAPKLESEKNRIAAAMRARKVRINWLSAFLIAAVAAFLSLAKWQLANRTPILPAKPKPPARGVRQMKNGGFRTGEAKTDDTIDLAFVDEIVAREGKSQEAAIPILQAIQQHYRYLPDEAMRRVCELTGITPAQLAGTSSFYSRFRRASVGEHIVRVCHGTACHVSGARQITDELRRGLAIPEGADTDPTRTFTIEEVACLGCCSLAPVVMVDEHTVGKLTPATVCEATGVTKPVESA